MTIDQMKDAMLAVSKKYPIKRVVLFGSRADGTNSENSDIDLIIEFTAPITLLTLGMLQTELEEMLKLEVDIIHGPIREDDLIEINKEIELYAA